jgi:hypothetical protein
MPNFVAPGPVRVVLERTAAATTELQIGVDGARAVLTKRTLRRNDPLDLPAVVQITVPVNKLEDIIRALQVAHAAGGAPR